MVQKIQSDGVVLIGITGTNNKIDVIAPEQFFVIAVCIAAKIRLCGRLTRGIVFHDGNDIANIIVLFFEESTVNPPAAAAIANQSNTHFYCQKISFCKFKNLYLLNCGWSLLSIYNYYITVLKNYKNELDRTKAPANTPVSGSAEFAVQMIGPYKIKRKPDSQSMPKMFFLYRRIFYINAAQCSTWFILYKIKYKIL